jgi:PAS domain S-box-containing protein
MRHDTALSVANDDEPERPLIYVNEGFTRMTGYSSNDALGNNCRFLQGEETSQQSIAEIRRALRNREAINIAIINYRKNGEKFWNRLSVYPIAINGKNYQVGIQSDVSTLVRADHEINAIMRAKNLHAEKANHLQNLFYFLQDAVGNMVNSLQYLKSEVERDGELSSSSLVILDQIISSASRRMMNNAEFAALRARPLNAAPSIKTSSESDSTREIDVLIVEDDNVNQMILDELIKREGYSTLLASDGPYQQRRGPRRILDCPGLYLDQIRLAKWPWESTHFYMRRFFRTVQSGLGF